MTRKLRSLVVDDDPTTRQTLAKMLEAFGEADPAEGGAQAVTLFRQALKENKPYHVVTLDFMMPEMDGITTLECIRGLEHMHHSRLRAKVLMLSGVDDTNIIIGTAQMGSDGYLLKPVERSGIEEKIRELFNLPRPLNVPVERAAAEAKRPEPAEKSGT